MIRKVKPGRRWMGKLPHKCDLLEELTKICRENNIRLGRIELIGAVEKARLGYYDQTKKGYEYFEINERMEITSCLGNISLKEGKPMVHCHISLAKLSGEAFGGHVGPGTIIFAAEFIIEELRGADFIRGFDEVTGLPLWED